MLEIMLSSGIRIFLGGVVAWLGLRLLRVRNPHAEVLAWRMLLLAAFALPVLLYWGMAPHFDTIELPGIVAGTAAAPSPHISPRVAHQTANLLGAIYLPVTLFLLVRLAGGLAIMGLISRAARRLATPDDVRTSERIHSPATFGNVILLPAEALSWPAGRLDAVLAHERAHVRNRDGLWSWLAQLHVAIFWFNPMAGWLRQRLESLAETTSDDAVVAARHDPTAYAALLLEFARHPNSRKVVMSVAESNVSRRIERLLARIPPGSVLPWTVRWTALAVLVPTVVVAASTTRAAPLVEAFAVAATEVSAWQPRSGARVIFTKDSLSPAAVYPPVAKAQHVSGYAIVDVTVDPLGQLLDVVVADVQPADPQFGFADAALQVARSMKYENPNPQTSSIRFKVKFELMD